jgi:hypothetical protein
MKGLLPDKEVKNEQADAPWRRSETDKMLDLYFSGAHPKHIAVELKRNPKAVRRRLEQFTYNERGWVERYRPRQRNSRKNKRMTETEILILKAHAERKVPIEWTARLLARSVEEFNLQPKLEVAKAKQNTACLAPTLDLILAHRHLYFVRKKPIISDAAYDVLVQEEIEYGGGEKAFKEMKDLDKVPHYIRDLALYLEGKNE